MSFHRSWVNSRHELLQKESFTRAPIAGAMRNAAEMPLDVAPFLYGLGFLVATAALHLAGMALGTLATPPPGSRLLPFGAAAITGLGVTLLLAW
jgi:hydrogenase/urease accessory protein HupE